jgi:hypothetical protein
MSVVQFGDEGVRPGLRSVYRHVHVVLAVTLTALEVAHHQRILDRLAEVVDVPWVDQDGARTQ